MPKCIRNLIYRFRTAWRFFKYGFGTLFIRNELVSDITNTLANGKTDTTMANVPTLDAIKDSIKDGIDMRARLIRMEQKYSGKEQLTQSIWVALNKIKSNLLILRIAELIMEFSFNSDELLDKTLHMEEREYLILSLSKAKTEMGIVNKFIDKYEYCENSSSVEM